MPRGQIINYTFGGHHKDHLPQDDEHRNAALWNYIHQFKVIMDELLNE